MFYSKHGKRLFDLALTLPGLVVLAPLLAFIALMVRAKLGSSVLFRQVRPGLGGRPFTIYKFRTMNDARGADGMLLADGERLTRFGRFLRSASLDELPELFNVLKGDMSLVGPRPLPLRDYAGFSQDWHRRRFSVKPGITCLWQVYGRASLSQSFEKWMQMDMDYIDRWSLWLDFKILAQTLPAVIHGKGAY